MLSQPFAPSASKKAVFILYETQYSLVASIMALLKAKTGSFLKEETLESY
jgi:hypothetical protein